MVYIGIDVSKDHLDVAERPKGDVSRIANDDGDINKLVSELKALKPQLIVMEATGGYEMPLAGALASGGLPVSVVNPRQGTSPGPPGSSPRPTLSMPGCSHTSPRPYGQPQGPCQTRKHSTCRRY